MKGHLILMEILVMVLVFALGAAACVGVFVQARLAAEDTARLDAAVTLAQNTAQLLKAGREPPAPEAGALALEITETPSKIPGLRQATITVTYENTPVFSLNTGWQERMT